MLRKSCQVVLYLLLLMAVASPLLQLDSWDQFPVSSDDIECQITYCLCILGMVLIFTGILELVPMLWRTIVPLVRVASTRPVRVSDDLGSPPGYTYLSLPLRI
ncbi:MAG TPA: hypothetical protein VLT16_05105 [Candidatus Limnocylindrales bacterium]|nr:hypothetical protein [Candidatus Limnocylindrales bacterium]